MMRWDKLLEGAFFSGITTVFISIAPVLSDGKITMTEGLMLFGTFLSGVGLYIKQHPDIEPPKV